MHYAASRTPRISAKYGALIVLSSITVGVLFMSGRSALRVSQSDFKQMTLETRRPRSNSASVKQQVPIWMPHDPSACAGSFVYQASSNNRSSVDLVVREAAVDWRHVSVQDARQRRVRGDFRRVLVLLTAIPDTSSTGTSDGLVAFMNSEATRNHLKVAEVRHESGSQADELSVSFDHLLLDEARCMRNCKYGECKVREWQAVVTIRLRSGGRRRSKIRLEDVLTKLARDRAFLYLAVPATIKGSIEPEKVDFSIGLSCVAGLTSTTQLPHMEFLPTRRESCSEASGSVTISGGALFGEKRYDQDSWREIAHYAARHLFGHTWYDTVAVALLPEYTLSEMQGVCAISPENTTCIEDHHKANMQYMKSVQAVVEDELGNIGVPELDWSRIVIFPFCRLGTDFAGSEAGAPCSASHHYGQKVLGHFGYTVFAPYHQWASNFDIDEFLVDEMAYPATLGSQPTRFESAENRFNFIRSTSGNETLFTTWFDFRVRLQDRVDFTQSVTQGRRLEFVNRRDEVSEEGKVEECYGGGGKVAISCERSVSFMIHLGVSVYSGFDLSSAKCVPRHGRSEAAQALYTWHNRETPRYGNCLFRPGLDDEAESCNMNPRNRELCA